MKRIKKMILPLAAAMVLNSTILPVIGYAEDDDEAFSVGVRGDYNGDGNISVFDLMRMSQYLLGTGKNPGVSYETDINGDGKINIVDFSLLKSALTKNIILWNMNNMPVMDGSTSEIPLETGLKSRMLGINYRDAGKLVNHHKTHESFKMLLDGENDLIFTVPISESQQKEADEAGVHLNFAPVAKEGFVFVVNKDNPVDTLTQAQIKDIYSGKITNWKELGGNDEKIIPYQRNTDSGSQNYMTEFMKDSSLIDPLKEDILGSMGSLMDAIAVYDNASGAIGYSVYSYAAQMYENSDDVKFIAVDGVKPSRETMADNTYPLLSDSYIIYTDSASQNTLDFVEWALSDEGQLCVLENGYVPVKEMEYPDRFKAYAPKGTGEKRAENYKPDVFSSEMVMTVDFNNPKEEYIDFIKDKKFQKMINEDITKTLESFDQYRRGLDCAAYVKNGYMSIVFRESVDYVHSDSSIVFPVMSKVKTLNYNLKNCSKIEKYSDLFYKDENFVSVLNNNLSELISKLDSDYVKTDFIGLTGSVDTFSFENIYLNDDNPYLTDTFELSTRSAKFNDCMVCSKYYDNTQVIDERYYDEITEMNQKFWDEKIVADSDNEMRRVLVWSPFYSEEETKEMQNVLDKIFEKGKSNNYCGEDGVKTVITDPYERKGISTLNAYTVSYQGSGFYVGNRMYFDTKTGDQIWFSDIFGKEFKEYDDIIAEIIEIDMSSNTVLVEYYDNETDYYEEKNIVFDPQNVNMKYILNNHVKAEPIELSTPREVISKYFENEVYGLTSSYILDSKTKENENKLIPRESYTINRMVYSHENWWFECTDTETGDYCGWVSKDWLYFIDVNKR